MPFIGCLALMIAWWLLAWRLKASQGTDLNALVHEWATAFYIYRVIPIIGLVLIFGIFKLSVAMVRRKETIDLTT